MFLSCNGQTQFPKSWEYNVCLLLSELSTIIENNGGRVKHPEKPGYMVNRSIMEAARDAEKKLSRIESVHAPRVLCGMNEKIDAARAAAIRGYRADAEKYADAENAPIPFEFPGYIVFVLDSRRYYIQIADNPFFSHLFVKTPIDSRGEYSTDAGLDEIPCLIAYDCMLYANCSPDDIREIANLLYNAVVTAPDSKIIRDSRRIRVPNTYCAGYHYERVYAPERRGKINW